MKKLIVATVALAFGLVSYGTAFAAFTDVVKSDLYYDSISHLEDQGFIVGYDDGSFGYDLEINRAELLKLVVEARYDGDDKDFLDVYNSANCFDDVPAGEWFTKYVCFAAKQEWIVGYDDDTFRPGQHITFVEALKIVMEVFDVPYLEASPWYKDLVDAAAEDNLIPLTIDSFNKKVTRSEVADMLARKLKFDEGELDDFLGDLASVNVTYETIQDGDNLADLLGKDGENDGEAENSNKMSGYYKDNLEVMSFEYVYDEDDLAMISFSLVNEGDEDLESVELEIVFQNNLLEDLFVFEIPNIFLDAGGVKFFSELEIDEPKTALLAVESANFYLDGVFFDTANVQIIDTTLIAMKIESAVASSKSIDFVLNEVELAEDEEYFVECALDSTLVATNSGQSKNLSITGLSPLKDYQCRAGLSVDGVVEKYSDYLTVQTNFTNVVVESTDINFDSIVFNLSDDMTLASGEAFYAKCIEHGVEELPEDEEIHHKTVSSESSIEVQGLKDNTDYDCYVGIQDGQGIVGQKSNILEITTDLNEDQIDLAVAYGELDDGLYIILSVSNEDLGVGEQFHAECSYDGGLLQADSSDDVIVFDDDIQTDTLYACTAYVSGKEGSTMSGEVFIQTP